MLSLRTFPQSFSSLIFLSVVAYCFSVLLCFFYFIFSFFFCLCLLPASVCLRSVRVSCQCLCPATLCFLPVFLSFQSVFFFSFFLSLFSFSFPLVTSEIHFPVSSLTFSGGGSSMPCSYLFLFPCIVGDILAFFWLCCHLCITMGVHSFPYPLFDLYSFVCFSCC